MPPFLVNTEGAAPCLMALSVGERLAVGLWTPPPGAGSGDPISPAPGRLLEFLVLRECLDLKIVLCKALVSPLSILGT